MSPTAAAPPVAPSHSRRWRLACAAVFLLLAVTCILKHLTFHASVYDLGIFHQVLWNTSRLRWFESSLKHMSYLGDHFSPGLGPAVAAGVAALAGRHAADGAGGRGGGDGVLRAHHGDGDAARSPRR